MFVKDATAESATYDHRLGQLCSHQADSDFADIGTNIIVPSYSSTE